MRDRAQVQAWRWVFAVLGALVGGSVVAAVLITLFLGLLVLFLLVARSPSFLACVLGGECASGPLPRPVA